MLKVEVFSSPGCGKCGHAKEILKQVVEQLSAGRIQWREVSVLDEMDYAVRLGVLSTPAIAVDGKLVFTSLPSEKKLRRTLERMLREEA
ncbi:MAG: thioredoxin family protein [Pseudomonadota bacterium]